MIVAKCSVSKDQPFIDTLLDTKKGHETDKETKSIATFWRGDSIP